ncbi:unnamed protein product [Dicrocoelium dendriticum]|nr:unnamed protein product [Dicrocoelium dendriticum]
MSRLFAFCTALTGSVQDLSLLRCDTERIFVLVATAHTPIGGATDLFFYEIRLSVLSNAPHAYLDSCRSLRPDVIRLTHLRFGRPMTSVCLWPPWSKEATTAPIAFAAESRVHQLHSFQLPEEYVYKPLPVPASTSSRVGFMGHSRHLAGSSISFHTSVAASSGLPTSTYTEQSGSLQYQSQPQVITHRRPSRRARAVTGVTLRLTPSATASISVPDAQDSTEDTAQTSQRSSILNPLKSYPLLRGSQCIRLTRIPGTDLLLVCYGDGVVEFIAITEDQLSVKKSVQLHENDQVGAVGVEFCGNFNSLISCGFDGLLMRTEIDMDFTDHPEWKLSLPAALLETAETESKELKKLPTHLVNCVNTGQKRTNDQPISARQDGQHNSNRPLFFRSSTAMTVADHSIGLHDSSESDSEALEVTPILSEPNRATWVEDCVKEARALEHQVYEEAQEQLRSELADIQNMINTMAAENEKLPEVQRISRQEFELDVEEQAAILEETENAVRQVGRLRECYTSSFPPFHLDIELVSSRPCFRFMRTGSADYFCNIVWWE